MKALNSVLAIAAVMMAAFAPQTLQADDWMACRQKAQNGYDACVERVKGKPVDVTRCLNEKSRQELQCQKQPVGDSKRSEGSR